jgi:hypothetical protein
MNYTLRQVVKVDSLIDNIETARGNKIDWITRAKPSMFDALSKEMQKTMTGAIIPHKIRNDNDYFNVIGTELELNVVAFTRAEYDMKINELQHCIQHLDYSTQSRILKIMDKNYEPKPITEEDIRPKKKYI